MNSAGDVWVKLYQDTALSLHGFTPEPSSQNLRGAFPFNIPVTRMHAEVLESQ